MGMTGLINCTLIKKIKLLRNPFPMPWGISVRHSWSVILHHKQYSIALCKSSDPLLVDGVAFINQQ